MSKLKQEKKRIQMKDVENNKTFFFLLFLNNEIDQLGAEEL